MRGPAEDRPPDEALRRSRRSLPSKQCGPIDLFAYIDEALAPLSENLKGVMRALLDRRKDPLDEGKRHPLVKQIAHGVHENHPRRFPFFGNLKQIGMQRDVKSVSIPLDAHRLQSVRHALGVAVFAARANLRTTRDGVPRCLGPIRCESGGPSAWMTTSFVPLPSLAPDSAGLLSRT
jgi:hypothetical protein